MTWLGPAVSSPALSISALQSFSLLLMLPLPRGYISSWRGDSDGTNGNEQRSVDFVEMKFSGSLSAVVVVWAECCVGSRRAGEAGSFFRRRQTCRLSMQDKGYREAKGKGGSVSSSQVFSTSIGRYMNDVRGGKTFFFCLLRKPRKAQTRDEEG